MNLEDALSRFLSLEKGKIVLNTTIYKVKRAISQKLSQVAIEKKTIEAAGEELENKINTFHQLVANLKQDREDIKHLLKGESDKLCLRVEKMLKGFEEKELQRIKQCLQAEIIKGFDVFRKDAGKAILNNIQETFSRFTKRSNSIVAEFKTAAEILFEVSRDQLAFSAEMAKDNRFYYMVQEYTAPTDEEAKSLLRTFLPKSISRKMVLNEMLERVSSDVSRNCGRTRSDLTTRIGKTMNHYSKQLNDLGGDLTKQIEQAIQKGQERRRESGESIRLELDSLANKDKTLEEYKESLAKIWNAINPTEVKYEPRNMVVA